MNKTETLILNQIIRAIRSKKLRSTEKSTPWTKEIKRALVKLGHKQKCKVRAFPAEDLKADGPQWLYDLCWLKEGKNWKNNFRGLKLVAEIEWSNAENDILRDFQKLTISVAGCRLMIIYYSDKQWAKYNKKWADDMVEKCKRLCVKNQGFHYLMLKIHDDKVEAVSWLE